MTHFGARPRAAGSSLTARAIRSEAHRAKVLGSSLRADAAGKFATVSSRIVAGPLLASLATCARTTFHPAGKAKPAVGRGGAKGGRPTSAMCTRHPMTPHTAQPVRLRAQVGCSLLDARRRRYTARPRTPLQRI
jgi:hypothetical protein